MSTGAAYQVLYLVNKNTWDNLNTNNNNAAAASSAAASGQCDVINVRQLNNLNCAANSAAKITIRNDDHVGSRTFPPGAPGPAPPPPPPPPPSGQPDESFAQSLPGDGDFSVQKEGPSIPPTEKPIAPLDADFDDPLLTGTGGGNVSSRSSSKGSVPTLTRSAGMSSCAISSPAASSPKDWCAVPTSSVLGRSVCTPKSLSS